ncbi:MAG: helix-turn-helix domain-containing protein [Terriglobales bacterium]
MLRQSLFKGLAVFEARYPAKHFVPRHAHDDAGVCLVLSGSFEDQVNGVRTLRTPAQILFHPAGLSHANQYGECGARLLGIALARAWLDEVCAGCQLPERSVELGGSAPNLALRVQRELYQEDAAARLALEGLVLELAAEVSRRALPPPDRSTPAWLARVLELLHAGPVRPVPLAVLSAEAGVHPVHLLRTFRVRVGCTPAEYSRRLRVDWARQQIVRGGMPLVEIALRAGFSSQAHFTNTFKRVTGITPGQCRAAFHSG